MEARTVRAAVVLHGAALRYAEVLPEPNGTGLLLRRLGTCDFDFAVDEAVFGLTGPTYLDTVTRAVGEVFQASAPASLAVGVHPSALAGFFTPLPEALGAAERHEQLRQEAALLADASTNQPVRIRAVPVRTETIEVGVQPGPHRWHHVLHVPETVHARLTLLAKAVGVHSYDLVDTTQAAAAVVGLLGLDTPSGRPYTLALGAYPAHLELAVVRDGIWYHGHHAATGTPEDAAYFAAALLERLGLGPAAIGRLLLYGDDVDAERFSLLTDLLDTQAALLDPLAAFGRTPEGADPTVLASYVPCLGVLLR